MLMLGLTGGIGAGKSTVSRRLTGLGARVVDADRLAREVVQPGTPGLAAVVAEFGPQVLTADGGLDRAALAQRVFADPQARTRLNAVLHPRIAELTAQRIAALPSSTVVVHDVPLLVENRMGANYHLVLVVHAPRSERLRRLVSERGMAPSDARARIAAQADDAARRAAADVWLDNSAGKQALYGQVDVLWSRRLLPFERNLRARRAAPRPAFGSSSVVEPDPTWPVQAARLAARVAHAAGPLVLRIDHHGSTAVPELRSRDVIDLQLVVTDSTSAHAAREGLERAGFIQVPVAGDRQRERPDAPACLHRGADPGRAVDLHVRPVSDPGWRDGLVLRDWLRARADERQAYAAVKGSLERADGEAYAASKDRWIAAALERARAWALEVGWTPGDPLAGEPEAG